MWRRSGFDCKKLMPPISSKFYPFIHLFSQVGRQLSIKSRVLLFMIRESFAFWNCMWGRFISCLLYHIFTIAIALWFHSIFCFHWLLWYISVRSDFPLINDLLMWDCLENCSSLSYNLSKSLLLVGSSSTLFWGECFKFFIFDLIDVFVNKNYQTITKTQFCTILWGKYPFDCQEKEAFTHSKILAIDYQKHVSKRNHQYLLKGSGEKNLLIVSYLGDDAVLPKVYKLIQTKL